MKSNRHDLSKLSDDKLIELLSTKTPTGDLFVAAKIEYENRIKKREFWRKDIVAWLALGIALCSLLLQLI